MTNASQQPMTMEQRLAFIDMTDEARAALRCLEPVLLRALGPALDAFYEKVRADSKLRAFFGDERQMASAKGAQQRHWAQIAKANFGPEYERMAQNVGRAHARIGLEPSLYINAYAVVVDRLIRAAIEESAPHSMFAGKNRNNRLAQSLTGLVKAVLVDMDLSISVYLETLSEQQRLADEKRAATEAAQRHAVDVMARALDALAHGDLQRRIDEALDGGFDKIKGDFNNAVDKLREAFADVGSSANVIQSSSAEVSRAADDLARRTETQAASLEETAAALEEITATVNKTADSTRHASEVFDATKAEAEKGGAIVREAVDAMRRIEHSTRDIGQIIGVIDEIAFQTNLLALNAGVEAARAGEAGRGFAVVASEVRALAQRSAEAAKEIKGLISASTAQVENGVVLVTRTGEALEQIVRQVGDVSQVVTEIAAGSKEQATGLSEVNRAVSQLDSMTQQNATMVEETTAASHSVSHEAEDLARLISRFKLDSSARDGRHAMAEPRRPSPPQQPARRRAAAAGGGRASSAGASEEEWRDF
ncbi:MULTISPECIES: globin-coupled sensor protein [Methylosinus]|uniref:Globin-coupled sensor protein n=1 Tax=Methylosinus trichosporium (strain ATCC 35070 / NCIMB 11131 / UNIQEM 75 / OB3b) TaxID=595536 RepID=A0A2D2CZJ8_METT3|nr:MULTISPECIES: globin-coupled sensor protein [Methylosinus]ATQ68188.1 globin-coupled sensor protein [Methylosinus trichosporium OB3b]OBS53454.1 chemotaxis protein [Methylosinus sp. 3S-1]